MQQSVDRGENANTTAIIRELSSLNYYQSNDPCANITIYLMPIVYVNTPYPLRLLNQ